MEQVLMPVFYLPPVSWFSVFLADHREVVLEQFENFPKQTYRNRANIYGANGRLSLIVPIRHNGRREMKDIEISYAENWQKLHWKSIKTAYQSSPYFEYYEHRLEAIYNTGETSLLQFNLDTLGIIQDILKTEKAYSLNQEYLAEPRAEDYREKFSAKAPTEFEAKEYYQTFQEKYGFLPDLSIVDALCNLGPQTLSYVRSMRKLNTIF